MRLSEIIFLGAIFGLVVTLSWMALALLVSSRTRDRLAHLGNGTTLEAPRRAWRERLVGWARTIAKLSAPGEGWEASPVRLRFLQAGYRNESAATIFLAIKSTTVLLFPVLFLLLGPRGLGLTYTAFWSVVLAAAGYYLPDVVLNRKIAKRKQELLDNFPDAVDLLTVCVEAGLGLDAALVRVAQELRVTSPALSDELHLVTLELRAGGSRQRALRNLALRTGLEELNALVAMLVQAERFGTSIGDSLRVYSSELRTRRRLKAEEAAAKIALKLLFPLIFCLFPALMLVLMGPGIVNIYRNLHVGG